MAKTDKILDKNFIIPSCIDKDEFTFYNVTGFDVYGIRYEGVYFLSGARVLEPVRDCALTDNAHHGDVGFVAIANAIITILRDRLPRL